MAHHPRYKRILLKLSGEALAGNLGYGIDPDIIRAIAVTRIGPESGRSWSLSFMTVESEERQCREALQFVPFPA